MAKDHSLEKKLKISLLILRLSVFLVMFMWTLDKFLNPKHALGVFEHFYFLSGISPELLNVIAVVEMLILIAFVFGYKKKFSYAFILGFHFISTVSSFQQYFAPFKGPNLLFFAAWPMLAACITLYMLREQDTFFTMER